MIPQSGVSLAFWGAFIGLAVAAAVAFTLTYFFANENQSVTQDMPVISEQVGLPVLAPVKGEIISLEQVEDAVFSSGAMGKGLAIVPDEGVVYAPFDGEVVTVYPSKHAIGLRSDTGVEILVHIGLDTVQLNGQYFEAFVESGQSIRVGDPLIRFDIEQIKQAGYDIITPVIVTNTASYLDVLPTYQGTVEPSRDVLRILV